MIKVIGIFMKFYNIEITSSDMTPFNPRSQFTKYAFISCSPKFVRYIKDEGDWWDAYNRPHFGWVKCDDEIYSSLIFSEKHNASIVFAKNPFGNKTELIILCSLNT